MLPIERQNKILEIVKNNKMIKLEELQKQIPDVSQSTIRRDIKVLEKEGKIEYIFGGAIRLNRKIGEISFTKKVTMNAKQKQVICDLASNLVQDEETIYIDSGSTCTLLLKKLINKNIIIYTTNTQVCNILGDFPAQVILIGGNYNGFTSSLAGSLTESILNTLHFDKAFFGVSGVDIKAGYTTPSMEEASKKQIINARSNQSYVLCDSSKFGNISTVAALSLGDASLITDKNDKEFSKKTRIISPDNF